MEEHKIKVKIAGKVYSQIVSTENEAAIRRAAQSVDEIINEYTRMYPGASSVDIATVVALNAAIEGEQLKERLSSIESRIGQVSDDLQKYVDSLK